MQRLLSLAFGIVGCSLLSGCYVTESYEGGYVRSYDEPVPYYDGDGYYAYGSRAYYSHPQHAHIYIGGRSYRYDDHDRLYYVSGNRRVYMSDAEYARNRRAINEYRAKAKYEQNRRDLEYARNKQKIQVYRNEQELKQRQARANYELQKKQYEYQQKVAKNRAEARQTVYRAELEQKKKEWEWKQKQNEAKNRAAVAKWKAEHGYSDKKKKKKD